MGMVWSVEGHGFNFAFDVVFRRAFASVRVMMHSIRRITGIFGKISIKWPPKHAFVGGDYGSAEQKSDFVKGGPGSPSGTGRRGSSFLL